MFGVSSLGKFKNLTGQRVGRLTVISKEPNTNPKDKHAMWLCVCDCGNTKKVASHHLKKGSVKSCGCISHKKSNTHIYKVWVHIKGRCYDAKHKHYKYYGGRGITVCDEWRSNFQAFYAWAMDNGYKENLTIDRVDNNKGYSPDNCRWVTMKEQANNKRNNIVITFNNKTQTLAQWAIELNIKQNTLLYRLRRGWSVERAFKTKVQRYSSKRNG